MKLKEIEGGSEKELGGKYIYLLSPVRKVTPDQAKTIASHAKKLEMAGAVLFNPIDDAPQQDTTGYNIVVAELRFLHEAAKNGGRVDVLWNAGGDPSEGSRVDVGIALALGLELNLVEVFNVEEPTGPQVCFGLLKGSQKEIQMIADSFNKMRKDGQVELDWDIVMNTEEQERQRILLGLALGQLIQNPDFKINLRSVVGIDPPEKKSYIKVMREIETRQAKKLAL